MSLGCGVEPHRWNFIADVWMCKFITRNAFTQLLTTYFQTWSAPLTVGRLTASKTSQLELPRFPQILRKSWKVGHRLTWRNRGKLADSPGAPCRTINAAKGFPFFAPFPRFIRGDDILPNSANNN